MEEYDLVGILEIARAATREHTTRAAHLYAVTVPVLYPICDPRSKTQCPLVPVKSCS
jgi:hypothetical protein